MTTKPKPKAPVGPQINSAMTIEEITSALAAGKLAEQDANDQLNALAAANQSRADYAMAALTGLLSTGERRSSMDDVARDAFAYADSMVLAEKGQLPEPQGRAQPVLRRYADSSELPAHMPQY